MIYDTEPDYDYCIDHDAQLLLLYCEQRDAAEQRLRAHALRISTQIHFHIYKPVFNLHDRCI